ncbi:MAG: hypothetical protein LBR72_06550 [Oscillospiraceae bacterium]|jgi:hypothetical protein|nr:hypothetical protein [Oscillospiraceae bacterium]
MTMSRLTGDVQQLLDIEAEHPNLVSTPLLETVKRWLGSGEAEKAAALPGLLAALTDGQDCDFTGTQWEAEWLAGGKVCRCPACAAARTCMADIELMGGRELS